LYYKLLIFDSAAEITAYCIGRMDFVGLVPGRMKDMDRVASGFDQLLLLEREREREMRREKWQAFLAPSIVVVNSIVPGKLAKRVLRSCVIFSKWCISTALSHSLRLGL